MRPARGRVVQGRTSTGPLLMDTCADFIEAASAATPLMCDTAQTGLSLQ
jgi:hypothetical protein